MPTNFTLVFLEHVALHCASNLLQEAFAYSSLCTTLMMCIAQIAQYLHAGQDLQVEESILMANDK